MLHQDYIVRMLTDLAAAVMRVATRQTSRPRPEEAARMLDVAVGNAVDLDGETFLSLAPESIAQIMMVTGTDGRVSEYVARSMMLASAYLDEAGDSDLAHLRRDQAQAIANAFGHDLSDMEGGTDAAEEAAVLAVSDHAPQDEGADGAI